MSMLRSLPLILALALAAPGLATAASAPPPPQELVQSVIQDSIGLLREQREAVVKDPAVARQIVADTLGPYADVERMSRFVLGRHWRTATPDQRDRFVDAFRDYLVHTYSSALRQYADQIVEQGQDAQIDYQVKTNDRHPDRVLVDSAIQLPDGRAFDVTYRLLERDGQWKFYDVVVEGVSVLLSYRENLASQLSRGDVDSLIAQLRERTGSAAPSSKQ